MNKNYGGVIWTNHALQRLRERGIKQGDAWATWRNPDNSRYVANRGTWVYYKTFGDQKIEVVAKKQSPPASGWLILSVWSKNVMTKKPIQKSLLSIVFDKLSFRGR